MIQTYITEYRAKYGAAPILKEIAAHVGMPCSTIGRYVKRMEAQGLLERSGVRMIATEADQKVAEQFQRVPKVGSISCGLPLLAEENIEEYYSLPRAWVGSGNVFVLQAEGSSMINAGIDNGDYVIVRQQDTAETGQVIVALVDGNTATLKRYYPRLDDQIVELRPENDVFETQIVDLNERSFAIQGIAIKVLKDIP
ncbi:MAG: repressor LexA [Clostridia bacterium]|nr:repressor LexA [Clostridia bacterium]